MERRPPEPTHSTHAWALTDGNAGNVRQATALSSALGYATHDLRLQPRAPWRWLAPRLLPGARFAFAADFARLLQLPPALATRLLPARGTKSVQILDPRIDPSHWDLVVAPEHDGLRGDNVVTVLGSLNPVDDGWLAAARQHFARFADLPAPCTALLLGGNSAHWHFDAEAFETLATEIETILARDGGSLLLTASRRTPAQIVAGLQSRFGKHPGVIWRSEEDGENPYPGLLAWADRIVCTPDSVNMLSEACATRVPVFVFEPRRLGGRPCKFLDALLTHGRVRELDAAMAPFEAEPLRETARIATVVRERLGLVSRTSA